MSQLKGKEVSVARLPPFWKIVVASEFLYRQNFQRNLIFLFVI